MTGDEGGARRAPRERRVSDSDDVFRTSASTGRRGEPRAGARRPRSGPSSASTPRGSSPSRWTDPAPTSGVWDPRGATPEQRREVYEQQLTWARVVAWAGLVLTLLFLANLVLLVLDGGALRVLPVVYALLWVNLAIAGATRARHMKTILGSDPEEPVEQVMARSEEVTRRVVYPAVVAFDAVCAVLVVVLVPQAWPVATAAGLVALALAVAWWRARRHRDHDSAVVDPPSARR
ncbi:hypothetical protein [Janibacter melonis]|uniref:hypothetical protein n=1 Tax=Janibacter melonis TaxID=262209 RepID=UPI0012EE37F3|nr:hypothetical protein [Janibacter melonis]